MSSMAVLKARIVLAPVSRSQLLNMPGPIELPVASPNSTVTRGWSSATLSLAPRSINGRGPAPSRA